MIYPRDIRQYLKEAYPEKIIAHTAEFYPETHQRMSHVIMRKGKANILGINISPPTPFSYIPMEGEYLNNPLQVSKKYEILSYPQVTAAFPPYINRYESVFISRSPERDKNRYRMRAYKLR